MKHLGLFEGIGGFSLAARWTRWETKAWVEIDPFCQKVMKKNFPDSTGFNDVKTFSYAQYKSVLRNRGERNRRIDIITGGFPCQPFSHAGQRKGDEDERALWYAMYRIIQEVKPLYVVAENVSGLLTIENGLVFERVCLDLENEGYTVQAYIIPACATDAPHRRDRVWIIAQNTYRNGRTNNRHQESATLRQFGDLGAGNGEQFYNKSDAAYPKSNRWNSSPLKEHDEKEMGEQRGCGFNNCTQYVDIANSTKRQFLCGQEPKQTYKRDCNDFERPQFIAEHWSRSWYEVASEFCRVDDGIPKRLDKYRTSRLKALGNAIVPQVAYQIFKAIQATEDKLKDHNGFPVAAK